MTIKQKEGYVELNVKCSKCGERNVVHKEINTNRYGDLTESVDYRHCLECDHKWHKHFETYSI